jgi:hypothetical protein
MTFNRRIETAERRALFTFRALRKSGIDEGPALNGAKRYV